MATRNGNRVRVNDPFQPTTRVSAHRGFTLFIDRCQRCGMPNTESHQFRTQVQQALELLPLLAGSLPRLAAEATLWHVLLRRSAEEGRGLHVSLRACRLLASGSIDDLFRELIGNSARTPSPGAPAGADPRIANAFWYIHEHLSDSSIRMESVAQHVNLSKWHFQHLLKRITGHGFRRFVATARLESARALLLSTELQVKEVAGRVGYKHASEMTRQFRQIQNTTPQAVRRAASQFPLIERRLSGMVDRRRRRLHE